MMPWITWSVPCLPTSPTYVDLHSLNITFSKLLGTTFWLLYTVDNKYRASQWVKMSNYINVGLPCQKCMHIAKCMIHINIRLEATDRKKSVGRPTRPLLKSVVSNVKSCANIGFWEAKHTIGWKYNRYSLHITIPKIEKKKEKKNKKNKKLPFLY